MRNFVTCHCHVQSLDTASTPEAFADREIELGTGYLTVTDHGTLQACRKVYDLAHERKLKPILGLEGYLRDDNCPILIAAGIPKDPDGTFTKYAKYYHVTLGACDQEAFETLIRVLSRTDLNRREKHGSESKPLFTWADLEELGAKNITMTSSCLAGVVQRHLVDHNDPDMAVAYYEKLRGLCRPGNFFVEVFPHVCDSYWQSACVVTWMDGTEEKFIPWKKFKTKDHGEMQVQDLARKLKGKILDPNEAVELLATMENRKWVDAPPRKILRVEEKNGFLLNECRPWAPDGDLQAGCDKFLMYMAEKYGDTILVGDDSHFAYPDEKIVQDIRLQSGGGSWKFSGSYHRQSSEESLQYFKTKVDVNEAEFEKWVDNSYAWASRFDKFELKTRKSLPTSFYPSDTFGHTMALIEKQGRMDWNNGAWVKRLTAEIEMLHNNGTIDLLPYMFIDQEVTQFYEDHGELTGPGRGSAAGVLLTYLLGITHVEPLRYGLSMERFLTASRIRSGKLPDIDQDLPHRELLLGDGTPQNPGWLKQRFGECFAQISVDTALKLRSSVKDVSRVTHGHVMSDVEKLAKDFEESPQGVEDIDFIMGYEGSDKSWVQGSIERDQALIEYVKLYPDEWKIVQKCLGLTRSKSRHACLPASESICTKQEGAKSIVECDGSSVYTGQGIHRSGVFSNWGHAKLLVQGEKEVTEYTLDTGKIVRCTPDHLVLTKNEGWVCIQQVFERGLELAKTSCRVKQKEIDAQQYANQRGGKLLIWGGMASSRSQWECAKGHRWMAQFTRMWSYEHWCRECSHSSRFKPSKRYVSAERAAGKCLSTYRRYDVKKGLSGDLTVEDVVEAKRSPCVYCRRPATGFERIDNALGHTKENCVPACLRCNWMRGRYVSHATMIEVGKLLNRIDP